MTKRAYALDALRGYAIITMVLSATVAWNSLPGWMYHAQTSAGQSFRRQFIRNHLGGSGFSILLVCNGSSFPFSIKKRFEKGDTKLRLVYEAIKRGAQLTFLLFSSSIFIRMY